MQRSKQLVNHKVFSRLYIVIFALIFLTLSVILFPKNIFEKFILHSDERNINLDLKYLEELVKRKEDPEALERLIDLHIKAGNFEKALYYADKLRFYKSEGYLIFKFNVLSRIYRITNSEHYKNELIGVIKQIEKYGSEFDIGQIYKEVKSLGFKDLSVDLLIRLYELTNNKEFVIKAVKLAYNSGYYKKVLEIEKHAHLRNNNLLRIYYRSSLNLKDYKKAFDFLKAILINKGELSKSDIEEYIWISKKAGYDQTDSILFLMQNKDLTDKSRKLLIKYAINLSIWKQDYKKAKDIILRYYLNYLDDVDFTHFILKSALATGDPYFAGYIAKKIAKSLEIIE